MAIASPIREAKPNARTDVGSESELIPEIVTQRVVIRPSRPPYTIDFIYYPALLCFYFFVWFLKRGDLALSSIDSIIDIFNNNDKQILN